LVYRNECSAPRVAVRLKGAPPNTQGIGARIKLLGGAVPEQSLEMTCGGHFLASDQPLRTFAAGKLDANMTLQVDWRSGKRTIVHGVKANYLYEIDEAAALTVPVKPSEPKMPCLFEDVSRIIGHRHVDIPWDDFSRQKLLPRRFSQLGPAVAWFDLNGDGREDLIIGAGRSSSLGVYLNSGDGHFSRVDGVFTNALPDDSAGMVGFVLKPGTRSLLAGLAHYENPETNLPSALRFDSTESGFIQAQPIPGLSPSSTGPLAVADVNGDGTLDVFVGSRLQPGRYPEPASSRLYLNKNGELTPDTTANELLAQGGLVTSAIFTDLDGDGYPELVLASEWGPVRIFHNDHGKLQPWDPPLTRTITGPAFNSALKSSKLSEISGWWTCVAAGDFDNDGQMDLIVGNWGLNSSYQQAAPGPWFLYYGDFNEDGGVHLFEAYYDQNIRDIVPWRYRPITETDFPWLLVRFSTHKAYSAATMKQILADKMPTARSLQANFLGSLLLLNRGSKFEPRMLPPDAQWSPAMGVAVGDLDGDGNEDLFISQNFFEVRPEDGRLDAGRGLLMRGDGRGAFSPVPGQLSGIKIYGEQRACALADYDADGRVDLIVTQNNDETRLFHNINSKPGLRVRLAGLPANPDGIGAVMRLESGGRLGPAREVHAGEGFWSQNSSIQVLGIPATPSAIEVHWPGGKNTHTPIPDAAREIQVSIDGTLKVLQ
ncbi:MAG TPA: FG-GAP-like repeat-containing protein, partial [Candidatus Limnocylindrales bacterium]|nr:FG-GAP-like repeat-containing protein [Candidatus Limnocylindrales bacterium]